MKQVKVIVNTKALQAVMEISVANTDRAGIEKELETLMKLTGGKVYICGECHSVHLTDEPMKQVYFARCDGMKYVCEECCADMGIFDVEILQHDFKRHNAQYAYFG